MRSTDRRSVGFRSENLVGVGRIVERNADCVGWLDDARAEPAEHSVGHALVGLRIPEVVEDGRPGDLERPPMSSTSSDPLNVVAPTES